MLSVLTKIARAPLALCCTALLSSCAAYHPLPLAAHAENGSLADLVVDARSLRFPALAAHVYDPADGLDLVEVAMLAVVNNPDLRLVRGDAAIARAQSFSAGLWPDPQIALARDLSNTAPGPDAARAFSYGLSYDVGSLLARSSLAGASRSDADKADLTVLWQEWQTASQAQLLAVKVVHARRALAVLDQTRTLFADRAARVRQAVTQGLLASDALSPHLTALQDVDRQRYDQQRLLFQAERDLNAILGLAPETVLDVRADAVIDATVRADAFDALPLRRPDLRALAAGYQAEDQRYRAALLAQFPALNLGLNRTRDTSNINATGIAISFSLPLFNRNRGNIAIELATRQKLHDEYAVRLTVARNDALRLIAQQAPDAARAAAIDAELAALQQVLGKSELAYRAGNADVLVYTNARAALLAKELERIALQQARMEQQLALRTLLGVDMDHSTESSK